MVTAQLPPVQSPLHVLNVEPALVGETALGVAVNVTTVLNGNWTLQGPLVVPPVLMQLMPAGLLVTVPVPAPVPVTINRWVAGLTVVRSVAELLVLFATGSPPPDTLAVLLTLGVAAFA